MSPFFFRTMKRFQNFQENEMTAAEKAEQSKRDTIDRMKQRAAAAREQAAAAADRENLKKEILRDLGK